jgi:hypothetical protein
VQGREPEAEHGLTGDRLTVRASVIVSRSGPSGPGVTGWLDTRKSVSTTGGACGSTRMLSGKKALNPLAPPKYISPVRLLKYADRPNSRPWRPSDTS